MRREEKKGEEKRERLVGRVVARCFQVCTVKQREQRELLRDGKGLGLSLSLSLGLGFEVSEKDGDDGGVFLEDG